MREKRRFGVFCTAGLGVCVCAAWVGCGGADGDLIGAASDDAGQDAGSFVDGSRQDSGTTADSGTTSDTGTTTDSGATSDSGGSDSGGSDSGGSDSGGSDSGASDAGSDGSICPVPTTGSVYVAPSGSDTTGNGSQACPFVTITKALSTTLAASGPTTIFVQSGGGAAVFNYGNGCTAGAGKCDTTPIRVTDGMNKGIVIQGTGVDPSALRVIGGGAAADVAVFVVTAPNVGFANLTVAPTRIATSQGGGARNVGAAGIVFAAPVVASGSEASVTNVIIDGVVHTNQTESTASGIAISNGTSPTIGPGVTMIGGDHGVLVTQQVAGAPAIASKPVITSSAAAPTVIRSSQFACVRVDSTNAGATAMPTATLTATTMNDPGRLHLQDCGGNGGVVVDTVKAGVAVDVTNTLIDSTANAAAFYGVRLQHLGVLKASTAVTITGIGEVSAGVGAGIEVVDSARLTIAPSPSLSAPGVVITKNVATGVHIGGSGTANIDSLTSTANRSGVVCDATAAAVGAGNLTLRNSVVVENRIWGAAVLGRPAGPSCLADLGNPNGLGNNVYNRTSRKNGVLGLCYLATTPASASNSTWGCGLSAASACAPATASAPGAPLAVPQCDQIGDYNQSASLTVALPQTCCGL